MASQAPYTSAVPTRVVIDSSSLQSDELEVFLAHSSRHKAVLTEYTWIEAYKADPLASIQRRLSVVGHFPAQVIVLKGLRAIGALCPRAPGLANRMIWRGAEKEFAKTIEALRQAERGDRRVIASVLAHGAVARAQMDKFCAGAADLQSALPDLQRATFSAGELDRCRKGLSHTREMVGKIIHLTEQLHERLVALHPDRPGMPSRRSRVDGFLFRYALASVLLFLRWVADGSPANRRPDKVRNDYVDLTFVTSATYFNGLMTEDDKARSLYLELSVALERLGARLPPHYLGRFVEELKAQEGTGSQ